MTDDGTLEKTFLIGKNIHCKEIEEIKKIKIS
jgi:hypothetical protein